MVISTVLKILGVSREKWLKIPKKDRDRIIKYIKNGAYAKAKKILGSSKKKKKKTSRKKKKSKSKRRVRRKKPKPVSFWW